MLVCVATISFYAFGDGILHEQTDSTKSDPMFGWVGEYSDFIKQELSLIESYMTQIDPEFVAGLRDYTDNQKIVYYNNYLAEHFFDKYYDFFRWGLEEKSKETGRDIKTDIAEKSEDYWLDRGILDSSECDSFAYRTKKDTRREHEKRLQHLKDHTCFYPDNFEEYSIMYTNYDFKTLDVTVDDKQNGTHAHYSISLSPRSDAGNKDDIVADLRLNVSYEVYDYTEWYEWENQRAQDIKDGMYSVSGPKKKSGCDKNNPFGCWFIGNDNMENWKSSKIPGHHGSTWSSDWSFMYQHN